MRKSEQNCDCTLIHENVVEDVKKHFQPKTVMEKLTDFYKVFADSTRTNILFALDKNELCVCDISVLLNMTISAVSHQLKILRDNNLVKTRRTGKEVFYSLSDEHVKKIIDCGLEHVLEKS